MLDTGDSAPDFSLGAVDEPYAAYMLSGAAQEGPVVVAFVPDEIDHARPFLQSIANVEWGDIIDSIAVYAVGPDSDDLAELAASDTIPFPILADTTGHVRDVYEVAARPDGDPRRAVVLVDPLSNVQFVWRADDADESPPIAELTSAVASISARENASDDLPEDI